MAITAEMVKELRERTGAGMMDCKRALSECGGDAEKAIEYLREKGLASAAKKAGRVASEGLVVAYVAPGEKCGAIVEVNCETDFVAKNEAFQQFTQDVARHVVEGNKLPEGEGEAILDQPFHGHAGRTVREALTELIAKIGENMAVRRFARFEVAGPGRVEAYIHLGGRIGVLVEASVANTAAAEHDAVHTLLKDIAMQVAAAKPEYVAREDVPAPVVEHEMTIYKAQAANEGKPAQIQEKIAQGRLEKFYKEICLVEQLFIKDTDKTVGAVVKEAEKVAGGAVSVKHFVRFERGEGLAKRETDFRAEVMAQTQK